MLTYIIDNNTEKPIYQYLYRMIKTDITCGKIRPGEKLPSKRSFAEHLGVSVITVENAYRLLSDEGYIYTKEKSGYFVCDMKNLILPVNGDAQINNSTSERTELNIPLDFPFSTLSKIIRQTLSDYGETMLLKPPYNGCLILRQAISDFLFRYRGITAEPDRIIIGSGAEYLYGMIVQLLGRNIIYGLENPSYERIKNVYEANGATCTMLELDSHGIKTDVLRNTDASVIHVTPFHSFPTGITANAGKKFEYLTWAKSKNRIIIEDDFASEFAVNSKPIETIFSMDNDNCVIYLNTFSKSLAPSMRMGYMILPKALSEQYKNKLGFYSCTVPVFDQYVIAEFINGGHFERHLNRMRRNIRKQRK